MSEDSKQLSVAELLARNAAQGAAAPASGGGGRRRRSGRGLSVTDLTGENATVRSGPSSHAAPAAPEPTYAPAPEPAPPASYEPPPSYQPAPYPPPGPAEPVYSPPSGPITRFDPNDPLGVAGPRPAADPFGPFRAEARDLGTPATGRGPGRLGVPDATPAAPVDPDIAQMFGSGAIPAVGGGGRRRRAEPDAAPEAASFPEPPQPPPVTGGRAARRRAAEAAEEAAAPPAPAWTPDPAPAWTPDPAPTAAWTPEPAPAWSPEPTGYAPNGYEPPRPFNDPGFNGQGPGFNGQPDPFGPGPDFNATQAFNAAPPVEAPRPELERRRPAPGTEKSKLPSWSARRHRPDTGNAPESGGFPTAAWSPVSQEQPLISGQSVAGDLLRQRAEQGPDADAHTEVYSLGGSDPDTDDYAETDYVDRDYADNDYSDAEYADGEYDDDDYYDDDEDDEPERTRSSKRAATRAAASKMAKRARSRASQAKSRASRAKSRASRATSRSGAATPDREGSRVSRLARGGSAEDANRRQWLILAGQSVGAAVAGMLLFKGFETMWETLPWVALALAMVVILGLVALVRVLRRTDDIFSTVIAVVVGVFVTLGPLAFLLSTS
ncbi:hypothetical protein ACFXK0_14000 [Nocardia sp. NPDC059177]|uniref:hypothetical protein n=1 Tax=Nocardia sp. NPDC059177 TaxID=3346759 RepID=UPI0036856A49